MTTIALPDPQELAEQATEQVQRMTAAVAAVRRNCVDAVTHTSRVTAQATPGSDLPVADRIRLIAETPDGPLPLRVLDGAHDQLAQRLDMPRKFYERLLASHPDLLAHNVSELFRREPDNRMFRLLRPAYSDELMTGAARTETALAVRAIVSDRYRPLDNVPMVETLLPAAEQHGLRLVEWNLDERRFALRFAGPERTIGEIREAHGFKAEGDHYHRRENGVDLAWVNEVLSFGVSITNSETGHGALAVRQFSRILRCLNAFVKDETHRTVHVGKRQEEGEAFLVGADTRRLDHALTFAKVRDRFLDAVSEQKQRQMATTFAKAMGTELPLPPAVPLFTFVDVLGERFALTEKETALLQAEVTAELIATQRHTPSAFSIAQGFTAMAKSADDFQRKQEIETMGWQIVEDPTTTLLAAVTEATKAASTR